MVKELSARALVHEYPGAVRALAGVDVDLGRGELVCVLGPNGSGKSTLLEILAGVLVPTAGRVEIGGRPIRSLGARERARCIARVPQALRALPETTVETFVLSGRYPHLGLWGRTREGDRAAVRHALSEVDGSAWLERGLSELSGGEHQRVLLARALAQEARLLLFDEPTASLDPEHQVLLFELVARLVRDGRAALLATHEISLASRYADRILLLERGAVRAAGVPAEVLRPAILEPVYGPHLLFADPPEGGDRPVVVPWPCPTGDAGGRQGGP